MMGMLGLPVLVRSPAPLRLDASLRFAKLKAVVQHVHKNDERFLI